MKSSFSNFYYRINIMEAGGSDILTNKEVNVVFRYRSKIKEIQEQAICNRIVDSDTNDLDFYTITPKDQLPKFLQKMKFQTLHLKEKDIASSIKVFKKENRKPLQAQLRKQLKEKGHLMLLSEIYQHLGQPGHGQKSHTFHTLSSQPQQSNELEEWEKLHKETKKERSRPSLMRNSKDTEKFSTKGLREGCDYRGEIERGLQIIQMTHGSESNLLNRYMLIENSSKLLKKELEHKKLQVEESIKSRMKLLFEARTEYHICFEQKNRFRIEQRLLNEEPKEDLLKLSHKSLAGKGEKSQKRSLIDANEARILRTKKTIEGLQDAITHLQQQLKKMMQAEQIYYKMTLKHGTDARESGLVWVIKKLQIKETDIVRFQFPAYIDRKSRLFLIQKAQNEDEQQQLLQHKRLFVNEIGRSTSENKFKYRPLVQHPKDLGDKVVEGDFRPETNIPKKYRKSLRKISALAEQFVKNSSLFDVRSVSRGVEISGDLEGMTHKEIYNEMGERIKKLNLTKMRKQKLGTKGARLMQYQSLLEKITNSHIKSEDMDLQHQNYLVTQYRDNRNLFFMQAAACFGYKRAYSMIIKHYSWKNYNDQQLAKRIE